MGFDPLTGLISGVPVETGFVSQITAFAINQQGPGPVRTQILWIVGGEQPPAVFAFFPSVVQAEVGKDLRHFLPISDEGFTFTLVAVGEPPGVSVSETGVIRGTPERAGLFPLEFKLTNLFGTSRTVIDLWVFRPMWSSPSEYLRAFNAFVESGSVWVAVGDAGRVMARNWKVGGDWRSGTSRVDANLSGVAFGDGLFVAVGDGGTISTSSDGIWWNGSHSGTERELSAIAWNGARFVVAGAAGTLLTSENGTLWTSVDSGVTDDLNGLLFHDGQWLAVGDAGRLLHSLDGLLWNAVDSGTNALPLIGHLRRRAVHGGRDRFDSPAIG